MNVLSKIKDMVSRYFYLKIFRFYKCNIETAVNFDLPYLSYEFKELGLKNISCDKIFQERKRQERYLDFLKHGHKLYGFVDKDNEVISYIWVSQNYNKPPLHKGIKLSLSDNTAYIWDCRTSEKYYKKGLYTEGLKRVIYKLSTQGVVDIKICNLSNNMGATNTMFSLKNQLLYELIIVNMVFFRLIFNLKKFIIKVNFKNTIIKI